MPWPRNLNNTVRRHEDGRQTTRMSLFRASENALHTNEETAERKKEKKKTVKHNYL